MERQSDLIAKYLRPIEPGPLPERPLVSVLMSNYNYAQYISTAIESVLSQTYSHFELIICDDGSTDDSVAVIQRYLDDGRIQLLQKQNGGQATGFNASFRSSRGEIICFLDADDLYLPTKLTRVVSGIAEHPDCGCVINKAFRGDENLQLQGSLPLLAALPAGWCGPELVQTGGILPHMACVPGLNLRRQLAEALFPLPTKDPLNRFPDMVMMRLVPLLTRLAAIEEPLATIRLHRGNTYQRNRVTYESLERELKICEHLWQEQRQRLRQINPQLGELLVTLEAAPIIVLQKYIQARLKRSPDQRIRYRRLLACMRSHREPIWKRMFWGGSAFLPRSLFDRVVNVALTQGRLKQAILALRTFLIR